MAPATRQAIRTRSPAPQHTFGYSSEDLRIVLRPMGAEGQDAVWSMGDDTPVAPFARVPRPIYAFFRQRFAQVTNPPIDPLRESLVMSLRTWLGPKPDLLQIEGPQHALIELASPVLDEASLAAIVSGSGLRTATLNATFAVDTGAGGLEPALETLCRAAETEVRAGAELLVVSDRRLGVGRAPIPMLLALGAVHQHLLVSGLRTRVDLLVEAGDAWDVHHLATLIGYGAGAVCPWLALRTTRALGLDDRKEYPDADTAEHNFLKAANKGLLKIMSKMGISTISSYRGAQIFECLGLQDSVVKRSFDGTPNRIGGLSFEDLAQPIIERHAAALRSTSPEKLPDYGLVRFRRDGEHHGWEPVVIRALHKGLANGQPDAWEDYQRLTAPLEVPSTLRDLLDFVPAGDPVPLNEVEPWTAIVKRFVSTAMSLGALSPEPTKPCRSG